jgi:hypothetical protein
MPRKVFVAGEILTAADVNTNLMDQAVMVFDDSAARGSAIPSPSEGMVTYLKDTNLVEAYTGAAFVPVNTGFTDSETITATDATWSVPALASPIVKVTVIGGGGGGGSGQVSGGAPLVGSNGGTTTFNAGGAGTVSAAGGIGGAGGNGAGANGRNGFGSGNGGGAGSGPQASVHGSSGTGGAISVAYLNLSAVSTVNITIGGGGPGGSGGGRQPGGSGGRGEVVVEYVAA